jgi:hypothetical protein
MLILKHDWLKIALALRSGGRTKWKFGCRDIVNFNYTVNFTATPNTLRAPHTTHGAITAPLPVSRESALPSSQTGCDQELPQPPQAPGQRRP